MLGAGGSYMQETHTVQSIISTVHDLAPLIAKHASDAEHERRLPRPVVDALLDAGIFRLLLSSDLGGAECNPLEFCDLVQAISAIDGSTRWCVMIGGFGCLFN